MIEEQTVYGISGCWDVSLNIFSSKMIKWHRIDKMLWIKFSSEVP